MPSSLFLSPPSLSSDIFQHSLHNSSAPQLFRPLALSYFLIFQYSIQSFDSLSTFLDLRSLHLHMTLKTFPLTSSPVLEPSLPIRLALPPYCLTPQTSNFQLQAFPKPMQWCNLIYCPLAPHPSLPRHLLQFSFPILSL